MVSTIGATIDSQAIRISSVTSMRVGTPFTGTVTTTGLGASRARSAGPSILGSASSDTPSATSNKKKAVA